MNQELKEKIMKIRAMAFDIDGVFTNGMIIPIGPEREDLVRIVDAKDSFAARVAGQKGYVIAIISGGETKALKSRFLQMHFPEENIYLGARGKLKIFHSFCENNGLKPEEVAYFGDDIPDTQVLKACGLGIVPADAVPEAKEAADYVCTKGGGRGCVREGVELIMRTQGSWQFDPEHFELIY